MAFLLIIVALLIGITALRNSQGDLANLLVGSGGDLRNPQFYAWAGAMIAIGLFGYIPKMQVPSRLLLALVVLVLLLSNSGVFAQLAAAFKNPPTPSTTTSPVTSNLGPLPVQLNVTAGASALGSIGKDLFGTATAATPGGAAGTAAAVQ